MIILFVMAGDDLAFRSLSCQQPSTPNNLADRNHEVLPMELVTSSDGTPIAVWRSGTGPPLVLVHGTTADHTRWIRVLPLFKRHFTVYALA